MKELQVYISSIFDKVKDDNQTEWIAHYFEQTNGDMDKAWDLLDLLEFSVTLTFDDTGATIANADHAIYITGRERDSSIKGIIESFFPSPPATDCVSVPLEYWCQCNASTNSYCDCEQ